MRRPRKEKSSLFFELLDLARTICIALIVTLLLQQFVFTLARVDGSSMRDTLKTEQMMAVFRASYWLSPPERGDVVLCRYPQLEQDCVKRIVGLPGERIRIRDSVVYIDDIPLEEGYLAYPDAWDFDEIVIPAGTFFVLGDNRSVSLDSRIIGPLPASEIRGKCLAVIWPADAWAAIR